LAQEQDHILHVSIPPHSDQRDHPTHHHYSGDNLCPALPQQTVGAHSLRN